MAVPIEYPRIHMESVSGAAEPQLRDALLANSRAFPTRARRFALEHPIDYRYFRAAYRSAATAAAAPTALGWWGCPQLPLDFGLPAAPQARRVPCEGTATTRAVPSVRPPARPRRPG